MSPQQSEAGTDKSQHHDSIAPHSNVVGVSSRSTTNPLTNNEQTFNKYGAKAHFEAAPQSSPFTAAVSQSSNSPPSPVNVQRFKTHDDASFARRFRAASPRARHKLFSSFPPNFEKGVSAAAAVARMQSDKPPTVSPAEAATVLPSYDPVSYPKASPPLVAPVGKTGPPNLEPSLASQQVALSMVQDALSLPKQRLLPKPSVDSDPIPEFWNAPGFTLDKDVKSPLVSIRISERPPVPVWRTQASKAMIAPFPKRRFWFLCKQSSQRLWQIAVTPELHFTMPLNITTETVGKFQQTFTTISAAVSDTSSSSPLASASHHKTLASMGLSPSTISRLRNPHPPHETLLHFAVIRNNYPVFLCLSKECPNLLFEMDSTLRTVAHAAVSQNNCSVLEHIYQHNIGIINHVSAAGVTPFSNAVRSVKLDAVRFLASHPGIVWNSCEKPGLSVVYEAVAACCLTNTGRCTSFNPETFKDGVSDVQGTPPTISPKSSTTLIKKGKRLVPNPTKSTNLLRILDVLLHFAVLHRISLNDVADDGSGSVLHHAVTLLTRDRPVSGKHSTLPVPETGLQALKRLLAIKTIDVTKRDAHNRTPLDIANLHQTEPVVRALRFAATENTRSISTKNKLPKSAAAKER